MLGQQPQCEVRDGGHGDASALSGLFRASWINAYLGLIPHPYLENMIIRRTPDWWRIMLQTKGHLLVLQVGDALAGYATFGRTRVRGENEGEIYELYLLPSHQGLGFGEVLFEACRNRLDKQRLRGLLVWALADNFAAVDFYRRRGGKPIGQGFECYGNSRLKKIAFAWD